MRFSSKRGDVSDADVSSGNYLRNFKPGQTVVRFLEEMKDWEKFREHYTAEGRGFPCAKEFAGSCPGCSDPNEKVSRSSRKYATNILLVEPGIVLPFRIPISVARKMENRAERNDGTLTNRDYVVIRTGSGLDTDYDVDQDEKYPVDIQSKRAEFADIPAILESMFRENVDDPSKYEKSSREDVPPTKSSVQSASEDDEEISEEDLYTMNRMQLDVIAAKVSIDTDGMTDRQVIRKILATA